MQLALWGKKSTSPVTIGNTIKATPVRVVNNPLLKELSLSSTSFTEIQGACNQILATIVSVEDVDEFTSKVLVETVDDGQYLDLDVNKTILKFSLAGTIDVEEDCVYNIELQNRTIVKISKQAASIDKGNVSSLDKGAALEIVVHHLKEMVPSELDKTSTILIKYPLVLF
ncbi:uncharacterized protein [Amphiura filiformis]|uniref:uncharacterized protein n=1 Tax=Amphiura filiformis TaxID=82378 RepID=UPI003B21C7DB